MDNGDTVHTVFMMEDIIREAAAELVKPMKERNVVLRISPELPSITGNRSEIRMLFRQLLSNAILFNTKESSPRIFVIIYYRDFDLPVMWH